MNVMDRRRMMMHGGDTPILLGTDNSETIITDIPTQQSSRIVFRCKIPFAPNVNTRQYLVNLDGGFASGYLEYNASQLGVYTYKYQPPFVNDERFHTIDWYSRNNLIIDNDGIVRSTIVGSWKSNFLIIAPKPSFGTLKGYKYGTIEYYYNGGDVLTNLLVPKIENGVVGFKDMIGEGFYPANGWLLKYI